MFRRLAALANTLDHIYTHCLPHLVNLAAMGADSVQKNGRSPDFKEAKEAPPSYDSANAAPPELDDVTAGFANLTLSPGPQDPNTDTCLAHLKLLYAFQTLKEDIGYTDGLWGLWNTRAEGVDLTPNLDGKVSDSGSGASNHEPLSREQEQQLALSQVREKRWALFVARAVDRYESWWGSMKDQFPLQERDMEYDGAAAYDLFPMPMQGVLWKNEPLPPLGMGLETNLTLVWYATNSFGRCFACLAFTHAQPTGLSRGLHASRPP